MLSTENQRMTALPRRQIALLGGAVLAAILAVALGVVERAGAVVPGTNGKIAFATNRNGNYEIYVMNANGSGQTRLTNNSTDDSRPAWSPDGSKIAFQSLRDGNYEVYVTNADGSGTPLNFTQNAAADTRPAWSPDGTKIAFTTDRNPGNVDVYVMNSATTDGSGATDLAGIATADDRLEAWSPDGNWIVFTSDRNNTPSAYNNEIYERNLATQVETRLTSNPADDTMPDWQRLP